jgi:S-adenosylmethionine synthetase
MSHHRLFTSESVAEGHPDKVADRISDEVLDDLLRENPRAHGAIETLVLANFCLVSGEVGGAEVDAEAAARRAIAAIGYRGHGFDPNTVEVHLRLQKQSFEIAAAVGDDGAGDQGLMFGFACRETPALMPAALLYAHKIIERLARLRRHGAPLEPDGKSQLTLEYEGYRPFRAHTVVVSHQHRRGISTEELRSLISPVIDEVLPDGWLDERTRVLINPSGSFVHGGPAADTGLTGRKIIVDTYGGAAPHGGGAFSGKDPTKVDRSGAYCARWLAKNIVAAGLADRCTLQLAYAIGVAEPLALYVDTHGTATVLEERIVEAVRSLGSLSQKAIRERLGLDRAIYAATSAYGHFGREPTADGAFSWERLDLVDELLAFVGRLQ